jgi:SUMO ligase MMS21 Smc5/6 complex component
MELVTYKINMSLAEKDERFIKIQDLIEQKRKMLYKKQKKINDISNQNRFLEEVRNDYVKFHSYILQQKQEQMNALKLLDNYIQDLTISGKLSKNNIEDAKEEQRKIVSELKSIKHNLDSIINDTAYIERGIKEKKHM